MKKILLTAMLSVCLFALKSSAQAVFTFECICGYLTPADSNCDICTSTLQSRLFKGLYIKKNGVKWKWIDEPYIVKIQGQNAVFTELIPNGETVTIALFGTPYADMEEYKDSIKCPCAEGSVSGPWYASDSTNTAPVYIGDTVTIVGSGVAEVTFDSLLKKFIINVDSVSGGGGGASLANNGLSMSGDTVQLGGTLIKNTAINGAFDLKLGNTTALDTFSSNAARINFDLAGSRFLHTTGGGGGGGSYENLFFGYQAGAGFSGNGYANTILGRKAGNVLAGTAPNASSNVMIGYGAGEAATTSSFSTIVGTAAASAYTTATNITAIGYHAGRLQTGSFVTAVGEKALEDNTASSGNTAVGYSALGNATSGNFSTAVGFEAGNSVTTAGKGVFIGYRAGTSITDEENTFVGYRAGGAGAGIASYNTVVGSEAGLSLTDGNTNAFFGRYAGNATTTGSGNVFIGKNSAETNTTGSNNIVVGRNIGLSAATVSNELNIGGAIYGTSLYGTSLIGIEVSAPARTFDVNGEVRIRDLVTDAPTKLVGADADGDLNEVTIGSGISLTGGVLSSSIVANNGLSDNEAGGGVIRWGNRYMNGSDGLFSNDRKMNINGSSAYIGDNSDSTTLVVNGSTDRVGIGLASPVYKLDVNGDIGYPNTGVLYIGTTKMAYGKPSSDQYFFAGAGNNTGTATKNIGIGNSALLSFTTGINNIGIGYHAGRLIQSGQGNIAIGTEALKTNVSGDNNFAIGSEALKVATGSKNMAVGTLSMQQTTTGDNNCGVGYYTLNGNTIGAANTAIGNSAMQFNVDGVSNVAIGESALFTNSTGDRNVSVGRESLYSSTGDDNTALGRQAGVNLTSGNRNILIGARIHAPVSTGSNQISIGNIIYATGADGDGTTVSSGNVGIKTNAPSENFHVQGNMRLTGYLMDKNNQAGTAGQILSSTVTGTDWVDAPAAPTVLTLNNGLTLTGTNGQWGGALVQNTTIDGDGFYQLHKDGRKEFYRYNTGNPFTDVNVTGTVDITGKGSAPSLNTAPSEDNVLTVRGHDGTSTYYANALFMGVYPTAADGTWIQSRSESSYTTKYLLNINPRGGRVAIGRDPESDDPDAHVTISQAVTGSTITGILLHLENAEGNKAAMSMGAGGTDVIDGEIGYFDGAGALRVTNRNTASGETIRLAIGGETSDRVVFWPTTAASNIRAGIGFANTTGLHSTMQSAGSIAGASLNTAGAPTFDETKFHVAFTGTANQTYTLPDPTTVKGRLFWIENYSVDDTITLSENVKKANGASFNTIGVGEHAIFTSDGVDYRGFKITSN